MKETLLFAILAVVIGASASASVLNNVLEEHDNGLEDADAPGTLPDLRFDQDRVLENPKVTSIKRRNPFARMFPQFEQIPSSENETGRLKLLFFISQNSTESY